ncbi:AAA family ATPase [Streptomyces sviceus]|uniref:AAA family ATPase n=1 Tax=Streptomyces sviceus TaxID=285530 RepID=UPI00331CE988
MDDVLRGPGAVPEVPVPFVGRDGDVVRLADGLLSADGPDVLVLHGPAGVGKSAVAAAVARRLAGQGLPVHWVTSTGAADADRLLLGLLSEHGAPRRELARAYAEGGGAYTRELRRQCLRHLRDSVVVLDDARARVGRRVLETLDLRRVRVIVTSRQQTAWEGTGGQPHAVRPLVARDAARLAALVGESAGPSGERRSEAGLPGLLRPARGLPPLVRVAGVVAVRGVEPSDAKLLLALALVGLPPTAREVLGRLSVREWNFPFGRSTLSRLGSGVEVSGVLDELLRHQVIGRSGDDRFELAEPVAAAVRRSMPEEGRRELAHEVDAMLRAGLRSDAVAADVLLDGRSLPGRPVRGPARTSLNELTKGVDGFTELPPESLPDLDEHIIRALAACWSVRGDTHRLIALHRRFPDATNQALVSATLRLGLPQAALDLLSQAPDILATTYEIAAVEYCSGDLAGTLSALDGAAQQTRADVAWQAVLEGAALCDQGWPVDAEAMLRSAAEEHRRAGCRRGRGWALLHLARACLLSGEAVRAEHTLNQACAALRAVADVPGLNRAATERLRLHLLRDRPDRVLEDAQRALTAHRGSEDIRGMGWTCQYLGVAHARLGNTDDAVVTLQAAASHFRACGDALGAAWARHRMAVLVPGDRAVDELRDVTAQFADLGCPHGQAWSLVELALRLPPGPARDDAVLLADSLFDDLKDESGILWTGIVRAVHLEAGLGLSFFSGDLPPGLSGREQLLQDVGHFRDSLTTTRHPFDRVTDIWQGPGIPLRARDLVAVAPRRKEGVPLCRVHLTLLDDSPTATSTARLLLRVVPEGSHPWATADAGPPWLTAVALPLTPAAVEPATCLLRPSDLPAHGAEFDVTAHRSGIHVIRFTIALERTGTVLQQVETELEILDTERPGRHAAPRAAARRGW